MPKIQPNSRSLEWVYRVAINVLSPFQRWLKPNSWVEKIFIGLERTSKGVLFDCTMCGQCILHSTGMTCPMTCPKELRNGPCGGVRQDGTCEILPNQPCIWLLAWERSKFMPHFGEQIQNLQPPLDRRLKNTSAWVNHFNPDAQPIPLGWVN